MNNKIITFCFLLLLSIAFIYPAEAKVKIKGSNFTPAMKRVLIEINKKRNNGTVRCVFCKRALIPATKNTKGVTPANNEINVDHIIRKKHGGKGTSE